MNASLVAKTIDFNIFEVTQVAINVWRLQLWCPRRIAEIFRNLSRGKSCGVLMAVQMFWHLKELARYEVLHLIMIIALS